MTIRAPKKTSLILFMLATFGITFGSGLVQAQPVEAGADAVTVDPDLPPIEIPPEILEQLNGMAEQSSAAMADVAELLAGNIEAIKNAEAIFDRMIETIRDAASNGAPDGVLVKKMEELADLARSDAASARQLGNMDQLADWFSAQASGFEEAKGEAISIYTSSFRKIREIEREKKRFVLAMKVKQYTLAKKNVRQGLEILKSLDDQIGSVYDKLPQVVDIEAQ